MVVALHRALFEWDHKTRIEIEVCGGSGRPMPVPCPAPHLYECDEELMSDDTAHHEVPALCWREDAPVLFERFQLRENTDYYLDITLPVTKSQASDEYERRPGWPFAARLSQVFQADPARRWRENDDGSTTISGQLRLAGHAGILDLSLSSEAVLVAEIVCRKIGYLDEFRALLDGIADEFAELLLRYDSPVSSKFNLADVSREAEAARLFHLRYIFCERNLPTALDEIHRSPLAHTEHIKSISDVISVESPDVESFVSGFDSGEFFDGGPLEKLFRGYTPTEFPTIETRETADTPENRYVKFFLEELRLICESLLKGLSAGSASRREVENWISQLDEELASNLWRRMPTLTRFPTSSQVLQKRRGYREILRLDMSLRMGLELPWKRAEKFADGLIGDLRPVSELYEYWCFFQLRRALSELCDLEPPEESQLVEVAAGLRLKLVRGQRSRISFLFRQDGARALRINLFYNRTFQRPTKGIAGWQGSYTAKFNPDFSLELIVEEGGARSRHWLHFDAKYRVERDEIANLFAATMDGSASSEVEVPSEDSATELVTLASTRKHRRDDLFKMHTYRDAILSSRGAYLLFPGDEEDLAMARPSQRFFVRHPDGFSKSPKYIIPSVGAFGLVPGQEDSQRSRIREFISCAAESLFQGPSYQEEAGLF